MTNISRVPSSHILLKNFKALAKDPLQFMGTSREKYGDFIDLNISPWVDVFLISDPEIIKYILIDNNKNYKKSFAYKFLREALGNGLLTNEGEFWLRQRRIAQPAFHREKLASLAEGMGESISRMLERWAVFKSEGRIIDTASEFMSLTSEIAAQALFSTDVGNLKQEITDSITIINEFIMGKISTPFRVPLWVPTLKNRLFKKTLKKLDQIIFDIIEARRKSTAEYKDLLTMLIEAKDEETGEGMSDLQLRDEVMTLFLAGSETSSNALSWTFYLLSQHPDARERLYQEVWTEIGDENVNTDNILRLKYTQMVIQESMRLYPPAWIIGKEAINADTINGVAIKRRTQMYISIFTMHRHPKFWDNPEQFDPLRFSPEKIKQRHKFAYLPFSAGPRFCIGNNFAIMEITLAIAKIAQQKMYLELMDAKVELEPLVTLRPKNGLKMKIV